MYVYHFLKPAQLWNLPENVSYCSRSILPLQTDILRFYVSMHTSVVVFQLLLPKQCYMCGSLNTAFCFESLHCFSAAPLASCELNRNPWRRVWPWNFISEKFVLRHVLINLWKFVPVKLIGYTVLIQRSGNDTQHIFVCCNYHANSVVLVR